MMRGSIIKAMRETLVVLLVIFCIEPSSTFGEKPTIRNAAREVDHRLSRNLTGACIEDVNHEIYGGIYSQMIFGESFAEPSAAGPLNDGVSGMWRQVQRGTAKGSYSLETKNPFAGRQSQRITFASGVGEIGIESQGLNHWGMNLVGGKPYQGRIWVRTEDPMRLAVALESHDGGKIYAEKSLSVTSRKWQRLDFTLTPMMTDKAGRFALKLEKPGSVVVGYAFLEPGKWGRFHGLPVRKDVAEGLMSQGVTVLRLGGSMVNAPEYRWKNMIGPRDRRPPYHGFWYPYSSDGWGIFDFLNLCEKAGLVGVPALNIHETPQDIADFLEYATGPTSSVWGARRVADGHPHPYDLKYIELGNEERIDESYFQKFKSLAEVIWNKSPNITVVVAGGGPADQKILQLAKQNNREVWFDAHIWTDGPRPKVDDLWNFTKSLDQVADGAKYRVVIFELNAHLHSQQRALGNAAAIIAAERYGEIPIVTSANCLQPDGQNNNGWDQGLLFLNPSQVWLQPPGYVTRMISRNFQPLHVRSEIQGTTTDLDISVGRSNDGKTLTLQVVNFGEQHLSADIFLDGFVPTRPTAEVEELSGPLDAQNTADVPNRITPMRRAWQHEFLNGHAEFTFQPHSFTVVKLE